MSRSTQNRFLWLITALSTLFWALTPALAQAGSFWQYPAIPGYGPVHVWPHVIDKPGPHKLYKALFDLTKPGKSFLELNPGLDHIARAVNTFAAANVPLNHLRFVVIIHGPATPIALGERAFEMKFHHPNPNLRIIAALKRAGVRIWVCGNALGDMHFTPSEVNPQIRVVLSALTTLVIQQDEGYALMRM